MRLSDLFKLAISNLRRRKTRTLLTILGVVIGTASIVVMVSLGLGMSDMMLKSYQDEGSLTLIRVRESYENRDSSSKNKKQMELTDENAEIFASLDHVVSVSPSLEINAMAKCNGYESNFTICGVSQYYLEQLKLREGGTIPEPNQGQLSLILGNQILYNSFYKPTTYESIEINPDKDTIFLTFPESSYSEKKNNSSEETTTKSKAAKKYIFPISGIIRGGKEDWSYDSYNVYADIDTLKRFLQKIYKKALVPNPRTTKNGKAYTYYVYDTIYVFVDDMTNVKDVQTQISDLGFSVSSNMEWLESAQESLNMVQMVLGGIGGVSLLVAAIGIMNTMMMSIYERTKEIGVMKVLGCDMSDIKNMFLFESGIIGLMGGIAGLVVSYIISYIINFFSSSGTNDMVSMFIGYGSNSGSLSYIPLWLAGFAIVFAIAVGSIAGYIPAVRAMKLSPLAAIRNE